jgi:hypothetical protein
MLVEIEGLFPASPELQAFAQQHRGGMDGKAARLTVQVAPGEVGVLGELAERIRGTANDGGAVGNPEWTRIAGRTAGSLDRLVQTVRAFLNPAAAPAAEPGATVRNSQ